VDRHDFRSPQPCHLLDRRVVLWPESNLCLHVAAVVVDGQRFGAEHRDHRDVIPYRYKVTVHDEVAAPESEEIVPRLELPVSAELDAEIPGVHGPPTAVI